MSDPTPTWQRMFRLIQENRRASDRLYEQLLAELHAAEPDALAQAVLYRIECTRAEEIAGVAPANSVERQGALIEEIEGLCRKQLRR